MINLLEVPRDHNPSPLLQELQLPVRPRGDIPVSILVRGNALYDAVVPSLGRSVSGLGFPTRIATCPPDTSQVEIARAINQHWDFFDGTVMVCDGTSKAALRDGLSERNPRILSQPLEILCTDCVTAEAVRAARIQDLAALQNLRYSKIGPMMAYLEVYGHVVSRHLEAALRSVPDRELPRNIHIINRRLYDHPPFTLLPLQCFAELQELYPGLVAKFEARFVDLWTQGIDRMNRPGPTDAEMLPFEVRRIMERKLDMSAFLPAEYVYSWVERALLEAGVADRGITITIVDNLNPALSTPNKPIWYVCDRHVVGRNGEFIRAAGFTGKLPVILELPLEDLMESITRHNLGSPTEVFDPEKLARLLTLRIDPLLQAFGIAA